MFNLFISMKEYIKTRVIALDIYGTILPTKGKNIPRKGLEKLLKRCNKDGLIICTCSDGKTFDVKNNLSIANIDLKYFDKFFRVGEQKGDFTKQPKNFKPILKHYNLSPYELTIVGDRQIRDINPALELGCNAILVPEYKTDEEHNYFDINSINIT